MTAVTGDIGQSDVPALAAIAVVKLAARRAACRSRTATA
jgi:hypothetical protein